MTATLLLVTPPRAILRAYGRHVEVECAGDVETFEDVDPLDILKSHMAQYTPVKDAGLASVYWRGCWILRV